MSTIRLIHLMHSITNVSRISNMRGFWSISDISSLPIIGLLCSMSTISTISPFCPLYMVSLPHDEGRRDLGKVDSPFPVYTHSVGTLYHTISLVPMTSSVEVLSYFVSLNTGVAGVGRRIW